MKIDRANHHKATPSIVKLFSTLTLIAAVSATQVAVGQVETGPKEETKETAPETPPVSGPQLLGPPLIEKDWKLEKWKYADNEPSICIASTENLQSTPQARLEVLVPDNDIVLPQVRLRLLGLQNDLPEVYLKIDRKSLRPLRKKDLQVENGALSYVVSPLDLASTIDFFEAQSSADIALTTAKDSPLIKLSLRGSSKILKKASECRPSKSIISREFERWMKVDFQKAPAIEGTMEELLLGSTKSLESLSLEAMYETQLRDLKKEREKLNPLETQRRRILEATLEKLQRAQARLARTQKEKAESEALLADSTTNLPLNQAQIPGLTATLQTAEQVLAPIRAEVRRLESELASAQSAESAASQQVSYISSTLNSLEHQRVSLENETQRITHDLYQFENEARDLRHRLSRLEHEVRSFNVHERARQILFHDGSYQSEKNELQSQRPRIQQLNSETQQATGALQALEGVLRECQAAQPPRDCSSIQNQVNERRQRRDQLQRELQNVQQRVQQLESSIQRKESYAQHQAHSELQDLQQRLHRVEYRFREVERMSYQAQQRLNQIQSFDLPRVRNEIQLNQSQLQTAQSSLASATSRVRRKENELYQYKKSSNYSVLRQNVRDAEKALESMQEKIVTAEKNIKTLPGKIASLESEIKAETALVQQADVPYQKAKTEHDLVMVDVNKNQELQDQTNALVKANAETLLNLRPRVQGLSKFLFPLKTVSN